MLTTSLPWPPPDCKWSCCWNQYITLIPPPPILKIVCTSFMACIFHTQYIMPSVYTSLWVFLYYAWHYYIYLLFIHIHCRQYVHTLTVYHMLTNFPCFSLLSVGVWYVLPTAPQPVDHFYCLVCHSICSEYVAHFSLCIINSSAWSKLNLPESPFHRYLNSCLDDLNIMYTF